ncbi:MAG TPA: hypothetical protein VIG82_08580 [Enteractinococcus sp.]
MGDVFAGRYELVDPLGEGGTGVVWRVWDHRHQQYAAAKVLRQVDASSLLRFMREQSLRLEHPHILTPTGWAGEHDKVLFTMPIASGRIGGHTDQRLRTAPGAIDGRIAGPAIIRP